MERHTWIIMLLLMCWYTIEPPAVEAGVLDQAVRKAAMRRILQRDAARDAATKAIPSASRKKVWRYTSKTQSKKEAASGVPAGKHMTSDVHPGRPPSPQTAQRRYGLPNPPEVRETLVVPKGTPIRHNKALGGKPGVGELTSPQKLPSDSVEKITSLSGSKGP